MKETQKKFYLKNLKDAQDTFYKQVGELAEKIRQEVIIPVCKRHNLEFVSGNGVFFFVTNQKKSISDGQMLTGEDTSKRYERVLKPVFEILREEVIYNQSIGDYVSDVREKDYK